ncbi:MAG TPA: glycosyltransferase 87 family protein [Candidatus Polarisedimenticolia bacterium]|nr:glycosyltransferase 87 family protein [Candidatus Polarisedimenticolia bacterium]
MRRGVAASLGLAAGIASFAAARAFAPAAAAWVAAVVVAALAAVLCDRRPPIALDPAAAPGALRLAGGVAAALALVALSRLAVFAVDPSRTGFSAVPNSDWEVRHSCLTAYAVAARVAGTGANVYDDALYSLPDDDPAAPRRPRMLGPFKVDVYEYPPPFLLLPRALSWSSGGDLPPEPEFERLRLLWFALDVAVIVAALVVVARALPAPRATRAILLAPLVVLALPTQSFLQKGNVQGMILAGSMLAMVLLEGRRTAAGGALLAFATASKLYPGLLGVFLLARRRWRDAFVTAAFGAAFALAALALFGRGPWEAFLDHMPRLLSGESFPAFRNPKAVAINFSIPGLVYKLGLFGFPASFAAMKTVGTIYMIAAIGVVVMVARRTLLPEEKPLVWLAILILATLRSPFLPQAYAPFPALWLLTLVAARADMTGRRLAAVLLAWAGLNIGWALDWPIDPRALALLIAIPQALTILLAIVPLLPRRSPEAVPGGDRVMTS